ncbi:MAG: filamentous hemagglutinin N-terminal domain-containing protein, partial [Rhodocyclaceae bacterium]|nr:filamentous hemagglutinin N-terminal domain-containing protein [Rhodocyclaceae bacterium]
MNKHPIQKRIAPAASPRPGLRPALAALCLAGLCSAPAALALPTGADVQSGSVSMALPDAKSLVVGQQSGSAIINWRTFNIAGDELVRFNQPSSQSVVLNRVLGGDLSSILGRLQSNGAVWLINPAGVLFGPNAVVDTAQLVASTLSMSNADFLARNYHFAGDSPASIVNQGTLRTASGGSIALVAARVVNSGTIDAPHGSVTLAAGKEAVLDFNGDGLLSVRVSGDAVGAAIDQGGLVSAEGGQVLLTARAKDALLDSVINVSGTVRAESLREVGGQIVLDGGNSGVVAVSGTLDAAGRGAGARGGVVKVLGERVGLFDHARLDVSGDSGGGTALIGGNWQGKGPESNARMAYVGEDARIAADALQRGNGGEIVLWSDQATRYFGTASARGGAQGGDGGRVEISGHELDFNGIVSTAAPLGRQGFLLLDPANIYLIHGNTGTGGSDGQVTNANPNVAFGTLFGLTNGEISDGRLNAIGGDIVLQATSLIQVGTAASAAQAVSLGAAVTSLTLESRGSGGDLTFVSGSSLSLSGGSLTLRAGVDSAGVVNGTDSGAATLGAISGVSGGVSVDAKSIALNGLISAPGSTVSLTARTGAIGGNAAVGTDVSATTLIASSAGGIGVPNPLETVVSSLNFSNTGNTEVNISNTKASGMTLSGRQSGTGAVSVTETAGDLTVDTVNSVIGINTSGGEVMLSATGNNNKITLQQAIDSGGGMVSLTADNMDLSGAINSGSGMVTLTTKDAAQDIALGGNAADTGSQLGLSAAELATVTGTGGLTIGSGTHSGTIKVSGSVGANPNELQLSGS